MEIGIAVTAILLLGSILFIATSGNKMNLSLKQRKSTPGVKGQDLSEKEEVISTWWSEAREDAKKKLDEGEWFFLGLLGLTHVLLLSFFPGVWLVIFSNPAVWILQILIILYAILKGTINKHRGLSFLARTALVIVAIATLRAEYEKLRDWFRNKSVEIEAMRVASDEAKDKARREEMKRRGEPALPRFKVDTVLVTRGWSRDSIIRPKGYKMTWEPLRVVSYQAGTPDTCVTFTRNDVRRQKEGVGRLKYIPGMPDKVGFRLIDPDPSLSSVRVKVTREYVGDRFGDI